MAGGHIHFVNQYLLIKTLVPLQNQGSAEALVQFSIIGCYNLSWLPNQLQQNTYNTYNKPHSFASTSPAPSQLYYLVLRQGSSS